MAVRLRQAGDAFVFEGLPEGFRGGFTTSGAPRDREDEALALALGMPEAERVRAKQVHGRTVLPVDGPPARGGASRRLGEADALLTTGTGRLVMVSTADCVPLLLLDPDAGVIAAVHAGWRGAAARIAEASLDVMASRGADPRRLIVLLGPSISRDRYEVGPEVVAALGEMPPDACRTGEGDRSFVDVGACVLSHLRARGVREANVFRTPICTFDDPRFPSYRREGARAGRILSGVVRLT